LLSSYGGSGIPGGGSMTCPQWAHLGWLMGGLGSIYRVRMRGPQLARMRSPWRAVAIVVPPQAEHSTAPPPGADRTPVPSQGRHEYMGERRPVRFVLVRGPLS
jgi:hypothetical protein